MLMLSSCPCNLYRFLGIDATKVSYNEGQISGVGASVPTPEFSNYI